MALLQSIRWMTEIFLNIWLVVDQMIIVSQLFMRVTEMHLLNLMSCNFRYI